MKTTARQEAATLDRYAAALESSPHLLEQLQAAQTESLSLRSEVAAARLILGETLRLLGRAHGQSGGQLSGTLLTLVSQQIREVNSIVTSAAAIEAKRIDQQIDGAKLVLLLLHLRDDLRRTLVDAGFKAAAPFVDAAFDRAKWTGALDEDEVREALSAPASFDVKFRPIERDASGKVMEADEVFDSPEEADAAIEAQPLKPADALTPDQKVLAAELEETNRRLDEELAQARASGQPLPGIKERSALNPPEELDE